MGDGLAGGSCKNYVLEPSFCCTNGTLSHIPLELRDSKMVNAVKDIRRRAPHLDLFRLTVSDLPQLESLTKGTLVSDVAKIFDVFGWFAPATVKMKILL